MDALKELAGLANHLRHGNVTLWAIADDEYCEEMGLTVDEQGETLSEFLHGVAERIDSEVRFTEGTSGKAIERADRYAEWLDDIEAELFGERIETFTHGDDELQSERMGDILSALENGAKRLMPEGMEWPRFEDGEPVRLGEHWEEDGFDESVTRIDSIEFAEDGVRFENEYADTFYRYGERVKRPTPKVLDADGVEIRVGDTVWTDYGDGPWTVTKITTAHAWHVYGESDELGSLDMPPSTLTHRAPVLAADGKPLREGETVYHVNSGIEYSVRSVTNGGAHLSKGDKPGGYCRADYLTHERPVADTWERLEEDAGKSPCDYFCFDEDETCGKCPASAKNCEQTMARDLVRRAKKLAGDA